MPTPSKFNRATAARIVELLVAGASRKEAARRVGIHHTQIQRWVARGDKVAGSGSRYATFADAVHLAETPSSKPILVPLKPARPTRAEVDEAWRFLQTSGEIGPAPEPLQVVVAYAPTVEGDPA